MNNILQNNKTRLALMATMSLMLPVLCFASDSSASSAIVQALTTVADEIKGTFVSIAPIALGLATMGLAWRYGLRFFKSLSK